MLPLIIFHEFPEPGGFLSVFRDQSADRLFIRIQFVPGFPGHRVHIHVSHLLLIQSISRFAPDLDCFVLEYRIAKVSDCVHGMVMLRPV